MSFIGLIDKQMSYVIFLFFIFQVNSRYYMSLISFNDKQMSYVLINDNNF